MKKSLGRIGEQGTCRECKKLGLGPFIGAMPIVKSLGTIKHPAVNVRRDGAMATACCKHKKGTTRGQQPVLQGYKRSKDLLLSTTVSFEHSKWQETGSSLCKSTESGGEI